MNRFVIGDIHGAHRALLQCFKRSGFDREKDLLICLGDLCDGWPDVYQVFDELLQIRNMVLLLGNHDQWLLDYFLTGFAPGIWLIQGGAGTVKAYDKGVPAAHVELLKNARLYYVLDNNLFVHGGYIPDMPLEMQDEDVFLWDRSLVKNAMAYGNHGENTIITGFDMVYVGHTPTINFESSWPITTCGVCLMDTGAGWPGGVLTMMDTDSRKFYQSDAVDNLYAGFSGRNDV